jgi:TatD DNase family protein
MLVDSHCHLNFPDLIQDLPQVLQCMARNDVGHALVVSVNMTDWPGLMALVNRHGDPAGGLPQLWASVGVHPDYDGVGEPTVDELVAHAQQPRVIAIGETGLDYFRLSEPLDWQRQRFVRHIAAARLTGLPLIIHTRAAADDTIRMLQTEGAEAAGGVMHCFTESWEVAQAALDLGFYISMSGIVTFKNAKVLHEVAQRVPLDRLLLETDSPYLAPVPHRGKRNDPSLVRHVAEYIAHLRGLTVTEVARATTDNFFRLFKRAAAVADKLS